MADGSIVINTLIDTAKAKKSLATLSKQILDSAKTVDVLQSELNALANAKFPTEKLSELQNELNIATQNYRELLDLSKQPSKVPTDEYKELTKQIEGAISERDKLQEAWKTSSESYLKKVWELDKQYGSQLNDLYREIRENIRIFNSEDASDSQQWQAGSALQRLKPQVEEIRAIYKALEKSEKPDDSKFVEQAKEINSVIESLENLRSSLESEGKAYQPKVDTTQVDEAKKKVEELQQEMQDLEKSGGAYISGKDTADYKGKAAQLKEVKNDNQLLNLEYIKQKEELLGLGKTYKTVANIAKKSLSGISKVLKSLSGAVRSFAGHLKNLAFKVMPSFHKSTNKASSTVKQMLKGLIGFSGIAMLFRKLKSYLSDGIENLYNAKSLSGFKKSIDELRASLLTLKNSFATAFKPIIEMAIPYIQQFVSWITTAIDKFAQFIAALRGQTSYTKAVKQTTAALKEQEKAQNKQLSGLDKLNNLTTTHDTSGMWEEAPVESEVSELAQKLKELWDSADLTSLGKKLGESLKKALDKIPWNKIKASARKMGKRLATLINGFVEVPGLGKKIGETLAEALNTGFEFLYSFASNLHWGSIGTFFGEGLVGFLKKIDWDLIFRTFKKFGNGIADMLNALLEVDDIGKTVGSTLANIIMAPIELLNSFIHKFEFGKLGDEIAETFNGFFDGIKWEDIKDTFTTGATGLATTVNHFVDMFEFDNISEFISNGISTIAETISNFFNPDKGGVDFMQIGVKLREQCDKLLNDKETQEKVGNAIGDLIRAGISLVEGFLLSNGGILQLMKNIAGAIVTVLTSVFKNDDGTINWKMFCEVFGSILVVKLGSSVASWGLGKIGSMIMGEVMGGLGEGGASGGSSGIGGFLGKLGLWGAVAASVYTGGALVVKGFGNMFNAEYAGQQAKEIERLINDLEEKANEASDNETKVRTRNYALQARALQLELLEAQNQLGHEKNVAIFSLGIEMDDELKRARRLYEEEVDSYNKLIDKTGVTTVQKVEKYSAEAQDELVSYMTFGGRIKNIFSGLGEMIGDVWGKTDEEAAKATSTIENMDSRIHDLVENSGMFSRTIGDGLIVFGNSAYEASKRAQELSSEVEESGYQIEEVYGGIEKNSVQMKEAYGSASNEISLRVQTLTQETNDALSSMSSNTSTTANDVANSVKTMGNSFDDMGKTVKADFITDFKNKITSALKELISSSADTKTKAQTFLTEVGGAFGDLRTKATDAIKNLLSNTQSGVTGIKNAFKKLESLKELFANIFDSIYSKVSSFFSSLGDKISSFAGISFNVSSSGSSKNINGYANGQVIPTSMRRHLAILGDNNQETEVVSPLSTIRQAVAEAMSMVGGVGGSTIEIPVILDGREVGRAVQRFDQEFYKQTGKPAFTTI